MSGGTEITVGVASAARCVVLKVAGRCIAPVSGGLRKYLESLARPRITDVYVDLSGAESIDSTFVGLLVSRVRKKADPSWPSIHLVNPSSVVRRSLESMHVLQLFDVAEAAPAAVTEWESLRPVAIDHDEMADLVIGAHESLIAADGRNEAVFRPVVNLFRAHRGEGDRGSVT